jgi:hypothetical protein
VPLVPRDPRDASPPLRDPSVRATKPPKKRRTLEEEFMHKHMKHWRGEQRHGPLDEWREHGEFLLDKSNYEGGNARVQERMDTDKWSRKQWAPSYYRGGLPRGPWLDLEGSREFNGIRGSGIAPFDQDQDE